MTAPIVINPDSYLFILYVGVRGIRTESAEISDEQIGKTRETTREVKEIIANVDEATTAKKLRSRVRAMGAKYCTTVRNFTVSDSPRIAAFQEEVGPLLGEIADFNSKAQHHPVEVEFTPVPLAASLSPQTVQSIYTEIGRRLDNVKEHVTRGDVASIEAWVRRNRALGSFLAASSATILDDAIEELKGALSTLRAQKNAGKDPALLGPTLAEGLNCLAVARGLTATVAPTERGATLHGVA